MTAKRPTKQAVRAGTHDAHDAHDAAGHWTRTQHVFTRWAEQLVLELQDELAEAAANLTEAGRPVPCAANNPDDWHHADRDIRAHAAKACRDHCPLLDLCGRYANASGERHGVWGGVDREDTR